VPSDLVRKKPLRNNLQVLNLFEKVTQENEDEHDNVHMEKNPLGKRNASSPVREKTSTVDSPQTTAKM